MAGSGIPTVDLSPFFSSNGDQGDKEKKLAMDAIYQSCSEHGFFRIVNHGVPLDLMNRALQLSKTFFEYPDDEKLKCSPVSAAPLPAGYTRHPQNSPDRNEYLLLFPPNSRFNIYPQNPPEFRLSGRDLPDFIT